MTGEVIIIEEAAVLEAVATPLVRDQRWLGLFLFAGLLMLLINLADPAVGLINIPVSFFLKNRLHLAAHEQAMFRLAIGAPLFISFAFGFLRDRWSPFGVGDRGHFMLFGGVTALIYVVIAFLPPVYGVLLAGMVIATAAFQIVAAAAGGLLSTIGQQQAMAGRMSVLLGVAAAAPALASNFAGGALSQYVEGEGAVAAARTLFLVAAGLMLCIALLGLMRPRALFSAIAIERPTNHFFDDIRRLAKHWPIYPVVMIQLLWQFGPAIGTVLQYHMTNTLHGTDFEWAAWNAVFLGSMVPVYVAYGFLCQRFELRWLLWAGFGLAVFQVTPLLFVHTAIGAVIAAAPIGIIGGLAQAALVDLAIRSCPKGLQGTMMMLFGSSIYFISVRFGDLLGTEIYDHWGGFRVAVWATIFIYALILPIILLVPKHLITTRDGEAAA